MQPVTMALGYLLNKIILSKAFAIRQVFHFRYPRSFLFTFSCHFPQSDGFLISC